MGAPRRSDELVSRPFIVACDWNGTLVDDGDRAWQAADAVLGRLGIPSPGVVDFFAHWRLPLRSLFEELGVPRSQLDFAVRDWNDEVGAREATLARGALEMVEGIRSMGGGVGIVSAAAGAVIEREVARLSLMGILDFVVGQDLIDVSQIGAVQSITQQAGGALVTFRRPRQGSRPRSARASRWRARPCVRALQRAV